MVSFGLLLRRVAVTVERRWDAARLARSRGGPPENLRIVAYLGHGSDHVVVRGRVLDGIEPPSAVEGESAAAAVRRNLARFWTDELPGVPLVVRLGTAQALVTSDEEGYFEVRLDPALSAEDAPWATGVVELAAPYRGLTGPCSTPVRARVPGRAASFGVISDVDDTILHTGAQRVLSMVRQTVTGSVLTRTPFQGAAELYRALARQGSGAGENPVFYVSSSPWNLHDFLLGFLEHRGFPVGPLLLRDLLGSGERRGHASHKLARIAEVLDLHPGLGFVLLGDSGQHDAEIYAEAVRRHPGRILAVYIREVRLDRGDGRVEAVTATWDSDVPFVLAEDSAAVATHAAGIGLVTDEERDQVVRATSAQR